MMLFYQFPQKGLASPRLARLLRPEAMQPLQMQGRG
jgi:hypothetical protein